MAINKVTYGGTTLIDLSGDSLSSADQLMQGVTAHDRTGALITGTATGGGGGAISVVDTLDANGGTIRTITAVDISNDTVTAAHLETGYTAHDASGNAITGTLSPGGGGLYPWFGSGAEKLSTGLSRTINLKNDTDYDNWTASTTATTLIAASATPDLSYTADIENYDYYLVYKGFVQPAYIAGATLKYTTYRVCQYGIAYFSGTPNNQDYAGISQDKPYSATSYAGASTSFFVQYFYNNAGNLAARSATQCGPIYMSVAPSIGGSATLSSGQTTITFTCPAFYAKCDANRFATARKEEVDSANTNYYLTVEIYRVPVGGSWFSKLAEDFYDTLNA